MEVAKLQHHGRLSPALLKTHPHRLLVIPAADTLPTDLPDRVLWQQVLARRGITPDKLKQKPFAIDDPDGGRVACVMLDMAQSRFDRLTALRRAVMCLLDESPREIALGMLFDDREAALDAVYVALANGIVMPAQRKERVAGLQRLHVYGNLSEADCAPALALAAANGRTRVLTAAAPSELTPAEYRRRIRRLARRRGWKATEHDFRVLRRMGAGAFCAVAQGSDERHGNEAAIVHLALRPRHARARVALVGKGICFDTGGHNLKPAKYMAGMHEDMNGSAVVLGLMQLIDDLGLSLAVDAWLPIAHNHLSPSAYKQNDIVTALDGTTIEVVHTDAEGRMVLADSLILAARTRPDLIVDFATLTGSMHYALGSRYSGVFASSDELADLAVTAGRVSGERVCLFPMDDDYETELESRVADIKQCTLEGEADHILAARFLRRFTGGLPWLHMDLSASNCKGGLGAVAGDLTGFGVAWGMQLLRNWIAGRA